MIANHPIYKEALVPHLVATLIYLSQIYSYYIRGDRSPLTHENLTQPIEQDDYSVRYRAPNPDSA